LQDEPADDIRDRVTEARDRRPQKSPESSTPLESVASESEQDRPIDVELDIRQSKNRKSDPAGSENPDRRVPRWQPASAEGLASTHAKIEPEDDQDSDDQESKVLARPTKKVTAADAEPNLSNAKGDPADASVGKPGETTDFPSLVLLPAPANFVREPDVAVAKDDAQSGPPVSAAPEAPAQPKADQRSTPLAANPDPARPTPIPADQPAKISVPARKPARTALAARTPNFASPPPMAPPQPRRSVLELLFGGERTESPEPPALPAVRYPAAYYATSLPQASEATRPASYEPAPKETKETTRNSRQSLLAAWLPKRNATTSPPAAPAHHHHHHGSEPCCAGCTCETGKSPRPAARAPQQALTSGKTPARTRSVADPGVEPASSANTETGSSGAKASDVTEEWKLFERVSFESFDKPAQR
jgi:hypothetical protein